MASRRARRCTQRLSGFFASLLKTSRLSLFGLILAAINGLYKPFKGLQKQRMKNMTFGRMRLGFAVLAAMALAGDALANPTAIARFKDWAVFSTDVEGDKICFAATQATDKAPRSATHGDVWFYVTSWSSGRARSQPSIKVGYDISSNVPPSARIGRSTWTLFASGNEAFAADEDDPNLVRALKRGSELRVEAVSERETQVAYHFSLAGSSAAIDRAAASCR